jgi:Flp pilus assembly protein TadD
LKRVLATTVLLAGCAREAPKVARNTPALPGERCVDCHGEIVRSYRATGMARAAGPISAHELEGLEPVADAAGWNYRFERGRGIERGGSRPGTEGSDSGWRISESLRGEPAISAELAFAIGAGLMDRAYAARVGDLMWFAPLEVHSNSGGHFAALAPGHSMRPGTRFTLPIAEECLACHTDTLPPRDFPLNLMPDASTWQATGISCAACHEGAEAHEQWRASARSGTDPIRTASHAGRIASLSLCARCHLQGDASFLLEPKARGIPPPGSDLLSKRAVFVAAKPTYEIGFVSQLERLVLSKCFTESRGSEAMTCLTCHDPHRSSFDPAEIKVVRNACGKCHGATEHPCSLPADQRGPAECVDCHMRTTGTFDVANVAIHDHWIRREPVEASAPAKLRAKETIDGSLVLFTWPGEPKPSYAEDPGLWMMAFRSIGRADLALPFAAREPGPVSSALPTYHHLRGSLFEESGRNEEARAAYARALEIDPEQTETAVNLGLVLGELGKPREGIAVLDAAIAKHPKSANALRNRAVLHLKLGETERFAADLESAFAIAPDAVLARTLCDSYAKAGRSDLAERWRRAARSFDPSASKP